MYRTVIVEDEKPILELMKVVVGRNPHYTIVGAYTNPLEALRHIPELRPDVVFLDVEMPRMSGLELAEQINRISENTIIVFTTAYKRYALEAFQVEAIDYILKPVTPLAIERVASRLLKQHRSSAPWTPQAFRIRCFGGFELIQPDNSRLRLRTRKTEELFAYFLCHAGKELDKWHLVELLWPDTPEERALPSLHTSIYSLKKGLKALELGIDISKTSEGYRLEMGDQVCDITAFHRFDFAAREEGWDTQHAEYLCSLYKGPLLEGKPYLWKSGLEVAYEKQYTALVRELTRRDRLAQAWDRAEHRLDTCLSIYPLSEEMNLSLLELYAQRGAPGRIARHFAAFEAAYLRELGVPPSREMRERVAAYANGGQR